MLSFADHTVLVTDQWLSVEYWWNYTVMEKNRSTCTALPSATLSTPCPTWNDLGLNPGLCSEIQVTKAPKLWHCHFIIYSRIWYITLHMITLITRIFTGCCHWREPEKIWGTAESESVARLYKGLKRQSQLLSHAAATSCSVPRSLSGNYRNTLLYLFYSSHIIIKCSNLFLSCLFPEIILMIQPRANHCSH